MIYRNFHNKLKKLVIEKLKTNTWKVSSKEIQEMLNNIYIIKDPEIYYVSGPTQHESEKEMTFL